MKPFELLAHWPVWEKASAAEIFASPAWRMRTGVQGENYLLQRAAIAPVDLLYLRVAFEDEEVMVGVADSPLFPELHALWSAREEVPQAVVLALLERECGGLFQALENIFRRQLMVKSLEAGSQAVARVSTAFRLAKEGSAEACLFTVALTPALIEELGQLKALDPAHETLRGMELPVRFELAAFALNEVEARGLQAGDALLLPEVAEDGSSKAPRWVIGEQFAVSGGALELLVEDGLFHVGVAAPLAVSFGALCEGRIPRPNECSALALFREGRAVAYGSLQTLGSQRCMMIEEVL